MARSRQRRPRVAAQSSWLLPAFAVSALALTVRLAHLLSFPGTERLPWFLTNSARYHEWAQRLLAGAGPEAPFDQSPGYALVLALVYGLSGVSPQNAILVQIVADALACAALVLVGTRLASRRAGIGAGLLAALSAPLIHFSIELLPASLAVDALCVAAALFLHGRAGAAGIAWAVAIALRPELLPGLLLLVLAGNKEGGPGGRLRLVAPTLALGLIFVAWVAVVSGGPRVPLTGGGLNLWLGNHPLADGVSPFVRGPLAATAQRIRTDTGGDPVAADREFARRAVAFWREMPESALRLAVRKLRWTLTDRELPNTSDIEWHRGQSWLFRIPGLPPGFGVALVLGLASLPIALRHARAWLPLTAPALTALLTCVVFFTNARFRLPILPLLLVLGGVTIDQFATALRRRARPMRATAGPVALAALGAGLAWGNPEGVRTYEIPAIRANTGILLRQAGHVEEAIPHLQRALAAEADDPVTWVHLALALEQNGDLAAAGAAGLDAIRHSTDKEMVLVMMRRFLQRHRLDPRLAADFADAPSEAVRGLLRHRLRQALAVPANGP